MPDHAPDEDPTAVAAFDVAPELAALPADPPVDCPSDARPNDEVG